MAENDRRTELDKLDIDELIEQTEEIVKEDQKKQQEETDKSLKEESETEEKPKKKLPVQLILRIVIGFVILVFIILSILESIKKIPVKTGYYKINRQILWISKKKITEEKIKSEIKEYRLNLKVAYNFFVDALLEDKRTQDKLKVDSIEEIVKKLKENEEEYYRVILKKMIGL